MADSVHVSDPYSRTGRTHVIKIWGLEVVWILPLRLTLASRPKLEQASWRRRLGSGSDVQSLEILQPRNK